MPLGNERAVILYLIWVIVQVYCLSLHQTCSHSLLVKVIPHPTCWTCCHSCQPLHSQCPDFGRITCSVKVDQKVCSWREEEGQNGQDPVWNLKPFPLCLHRYRVFFNLPSPFSESNIETVSILYILYLVPAELCNLINTSTISKEFQMALIHLKISEKWKKAKSEEGKMGNSCSFGGTKKQKLPEFVPVGLRQYFSFSSIPWFHFFFRGWWRIKRSGPTSGDFTRTSSDIWGEGKICP